MNTSSFPVVFRRQLRFWTFHCIMNSLPSLAIALGVVGLWRKPLAIAAMFTAIATFVFLYAALTSLQGPLTDEKHVLSRAIKLGSKIRAWISGLSLLLVFPPLFFMMPDFWCGYLATSIVESAGRTVFAGPSSPSWIENDGFAKIYATTMLEGLILSFILAMFSFFAVMFLQARDRRNFFALADSR